MSGRLRTGVDYKLGESETPAAGVKTKQMEVTFLGSSNAFAAEGRYWSSFLVDKHYLFDAPPTLLPHLKQLEGPAYLDIEVLFLTHHHGDHFIGLPFLFLEYMYMTKRTNDLYIVGPPGVEEWIEDFADRCYPNITQDAGYKRIYIDAVPRKQQQAGSVSFWSVPMNHVKDHMDAFGYRVTISGKTIAYTGDTMFCDEVYRAGRGQPTFSSSTAPTPKAAARSTWAWTTSRSSASASHPETAIVLTHLNGTPHLDGLKNVVTAEDLKTFRSRPDLHAA